VHYSHVQLLYVQTGNDAMEITRMLPNDRSWRVRFNNTGAKHSQIPANAGFC